MILDATDSGLIDGIELNYDESKKDDLDRTLLWVVDSGEPLLICPVSRLFGFTPGGTAPKTLFSSAESNTLHFDWPIVHYGRMRINLTGPTDSILGASVSHQSLPEVEARYRGRLRVLHQSINAQDQESVQLFRLNGRGHLAEIWMRVHGSATDPKRRLTYLEGDERIYIDGDDSRTVTLKGTGIEDFFNGAFYFVGGVSTSPSYGISHYDPGDESDGETDLEMYRILTTDTIPFEHSLGFVWEIVPEWRNWPLGFEVVVFWYDCSGCPEDRVWPDDLGWDLDRDGAVDAKDSLLFQGTLRDATSKNQFDLPWPFRLMRKWTGPGQNTWLDMK